jgi:DNA-directed RNA polymerase specialized sigma24 family protein
MATLQARLARGDQAAFADLYDAYADRISHYLLVRLGSPDDADDVLQETFLRIARRPRRLAKVNDLEAYLITIARKGDLGSERI